MVCRYDKVPDVRIVGQAADFLVQFFHSLLAGRKDLVFRAGLIAAGIDLVVVNIHQRLAREVAAQFVAAHILHLVELDAAAVFLCRLQDAFPCSSAHRFLSKDGYGAVRLNLQTDMRQQCCHAELCIGGHCADSRGQLCRAFCIHRQRFKKLLCHFVPHGIRDKHHHALPCPTDILAVKMGLTLRLEGGQIVGQALAPTHRQWIEEAAGIHFFHKCLQLFNLLCTDDFSIAQVELPISRIHLPCAATILRRQCINAICRDEMHCLQNGAGIGQQAIQLFLGILCAKVGLAALLADLPDAVPLQGCRCVFFHQAVHDPAADLCLCRSEHRTVQQ